MLFRLYVHKHKEVCPGPKFNRLSDAKQFGFMIARDNPIWTVRVRRIIGRTEETIGEIRMTGFSPTYKRYRDPKPEALDEIYGKPEEDDRYD
jgi:hypothetical protein